MMKKKYKILGLVLALALVMAVFASCGSSGDTGSADTDAGDTIVSGIIDVKYTERDLDGTWDESEATAVALSGESYTISEEGVYVFTGSLDDGQIIVDAGDTDKVQIVLNGVTLHCDDAPAIMVENADKVFLTLAEGSENTVSDGSSYASSEDEPWGAIFSHDNLTINGSGSLSVEGNYQHGIVSKDDLKITGGTVTVKAADDGLRGRDSVRIYDGTINIDASGDGIKSNNDEETDKGFVSIDGGEITINGVSSQGIDAYNIAQVTGGTLNIESSNEGIQGKTVYIQDGTINVDVVDDCLNATDSNQQAGESAMSGVSLQIVGGTINLSTTAGDGLDSNGDLSMSGGMVILQGSSGGVEVCMDYNGTGSITGGTIIAVGNSQMGQNFDENSTQGALMYSASGSQGDEVVLTDSDGNEIASLTAARSFTSVLVSSPSMKEGETYTLKVGSNSVDIEMTSLIVTQSGMGGMGGMDQPGMSGGFGGGGMGGGGRGPQ